MKNISLFLFTLLLVNSVSSKDYQIEEIEFTSHKIRLSGSLVYPKNRNVHAAVVFVHGSGEQKRNINIGKRFAKDGIAALVYDKRGVGRSEGKYESNQSVSGINISLLADDTVAALNALSKHEITKSIPLGLSGISQAGWIVPLAAEKSDKVDFLALWSSPVCKVSEEDIFSKYTADHDGKKVPSYNEALKARKTPYIWPDFLGVDTNPSESLAKLNIPGLWIFGTNDGSVPVDLSINRLTKLTDLGLNYNYVLFSGLGHNNMPDTFATVTGWIKRLK